MILSIISIIVTGYIALLTLNVTLILIDELHFYILRITDKEKDPEVDELVDEIRSTFRSLEHNPLRIMRLTDLPCNIDTFLDTLTGLAGISWYSDMRMYSVNKRIIDMGHKYFEKTEDKMLYEATIRPRAVKDLEECEKKYPISCKLASKLK